MKKGVILSTVMGLALAFMTSCSTEKSCAELGTCPGEHAERIDILIEGGLDLWESTSVDISNEKTGPVEYVNENSTDGEFKVILQMSTGEQLALSIKSNTSATVIDEFDTPYTAFAGNNLDHLSRYVSAEYRKQGDVPTYSTNPGFEFSAPQSRNCFYFVSHEGNLLRGRINDLKLYQVNDISNYITVNGTFVGYIAN